MPGKVWHRSKARIRRLLGGAPARAQITPESTHEPPQETTQTSIHESTPGSARSSPPPSPPSLHDSMDDSVFALDPAYRFTLDPMHGSARELAIGPTGESADESTCRLPYDIIEMVITYLAGDFDTLKACALTCRSWRVATAPRIHHTLLLGERTGFFRSELGRVSQMHSLGLTPLIKEIQLTQGRAGWFSPQAFNPSNLEHFTAFSNVHTLRIQGLDIPRFIPDVKNYFGHFSTTVRSITLDEPVCHTPEQLPYFLSLFQNLDDIEVREFSPTQPPSSDTELVPFSAPKLRGRLTLYKFHWAEPWTYLIAACGGLRFRYMNLRDVGACAPVLLEACSETLEVLRLYVADGQDAQPELHNLELSQLNALRSLEVGDWVNPFGGADIYRAIISGLFAKIMSPVFSELVIVLWEGQFTGLLADTASHEMLEKMHRLVPFRLVFLLQDIHLPSDETRQGLEKALESARGKGHFDFLDCPPVIRSEKIPLVAGSPNFDWVPRARRHSSETVYLIQ